MCRLCWKFLALAVKIINRALIGDSNTYYQCVGHNEYCHFTLQMTLDYKTSYGSTVDDGVSIAGYRM